MFKYIAANTNLTFRITNLDITGFDQGFILQLCWISVIFQGANFRPYTFDFWYHYWAVLL